MKSQMRLNHEGRAVRLTNFIDEESVAFEKEAQAMMVDAPLEQRLVYFTHYKQPILILQVRAIDGSPALQACVQLGRPSFLPWFTMATVRNFHSAKSGDEEEFGLSVLKTLVSRKPGVMSIRIQPKRYHEQDLNHFNSAASRQGYHLASDPLGFTRTLLLDLRSSAEELLASFPSRTRVRFKHPSRDQVEIRPLTDLCYLKACRDAANRSRDRTGSGASSDSFENLFALANSHPDRVKILGLFFKDQPLELMAYLIAFNNGKRLELHSAGSIQNAALRSIPFNSFLVWELTQWGRTLGCTQMDMGGVSSGDAQDPLRGITQFKRSITNVEVETGREMIYLARPQHLKLYHWLKHMKASAPL